MNVRLRVTFALAVCLITLAAATASAQVQVALPIYNPAPASSWPSDFTKVGSKVFFTASTLAQGRELWVTDGTAAGTLLVKDITAGRASSYIDAITEFKGSAYFMVGGRLWRSNGTAAGTILVKDLGSSTARVYSAGTLLYIHRLTSYYASDLWVSDGTAARTLRVRSFAGSVDAPFGHKGKLFFTAAEDALLGRQLWTSDGTLFGTRVLAYGAFCPTRGCQKMVDFFRLGTKLLFTARRDAYDSAHEGDLWETDGTDAGTVLVRAGAGALVAHSPTVAFLESRTATGSRLMKSNGTTAGTVPVAELGGRIDFGRMTGNILFANVRVTYNAPSELWKSDGTPAGTFRLMAASSTHGPPDFIGAGTASRYIFSHTTAGAGEELWSSDGTAGGTALLVDVFAGTLSSTPSAFWSAGGYVLFSAETPGIGRELWRSDGTAAGTALLLNLAPEEGTGEITGTVRDAATGAPIAAAEISVYDLSGTRLVTVNSATDGTYRVDKLTTDSYYLRALAATHVPQVYPNIDCSTCGAWRGQRVAVTALMATTGVDFPLAAGARITGKVTFKGQPVADALVTIQDAANTIVSRVQTAADGTYISAPGLPTGVYYAGAMPQNDIGASPVVYGGAPCPSYSYYYYGCAPYSTGNAITATAGKTTSAINFALLAWPQISGRVISTTGEPAAGLAVRLYGSQGASVNDATTSATGHYSMTVREPGTFYAGVDGAPKRYVSQIYHQQNCTTSCDPLAGRPIPLDYNAVATGVDFVLQRTAGVIRGSVKDAVTGVPVRVSVVLYNTNGAEVRVDSDNGWGNVVDSAGNFELRNVQPGTYYLRTGDYLYKGIDCTDGCSVTSGTPIVVTSADSTITLAVAYPHTALVSGYVTDAATGLPIQHVHVSWRAADSYGSELMTASTDAQGKYTISKPSRSAYLAFRTPDHIAEAWADKVLACRSACPPPAGAVIFNPATMTLDRANVNAALAKRPTIQGAIRDSNGQLHTKSLDVTFYDSAGLETGRTYAYAGTYAWKAPTAGTFYARAGGWIDNRYLHQIYEGITCSPCDITTGTPITVAVGATTSGIDFFFPAAAPPPPPTFIAGTIYDAATGAPLPGAKVEGANARYSYESWWLVTTTDSSGKYKIQVEPDQSYRIRAYRQEGVYYVQTHGGAACTSLSACTSTTGTIVAAPGGATTTVDIRLPKMSVTAISPRSGPLSGNTRVTLTGANFPPNASVTIDGVAATVVSVTASQLVLLTPLGSLGLANVHIRAGDLLLTLPDAFTYVAAAAGDFNGDFRSDVFWRDTTTGATDAWLMDGRFAPVTQTLPPLATSWHVQTLGDFDGNGAADVFWRNPSTGANLVWFMRDGAPQSVALSPVAAAFRVAGAGDFDLDGKADLLWRNAGTGANVIWFGTGTGFRGVTITALASPWEPQAIADVTGDGRADVVWHNPTTTDVAVWAMKGATRTEKLIGKMTSVWRIAAAADTDGDGLSDILWRKPDTGEQTLWLMGLSSFTARPLARVAAAMRPFGMADVTGDGRADILWRNGSTGQQLVWSMNGSTVVSTFALPTRDLHVTPHMAH